MTADPIQSLSGLRVLVTGGSGFIGRRLCARAAALGAEVHAAGRGARGPSDELAWERADLTDESAARRVIERVDPAVVFHLASEVSGGRGSELVLPMLRANLLAAVNVMLACADAGSPRVVLAGSMEEPDLGEPEATVQSPYAAAKWATAAYARLFGSLYELSVVHLRLFMVYGPEQLDLRKVVPYTIVSLLRGRSPELTSGERRVDWVFVDDVVDAFVRAAVAEGVDGVSLDIGSGELTTVRDVVERLRELVGGEVEPALGAVEDRPLERERAADPGPAAAALGWRPRTPLGDGLTRTVDFYRANLDDLPEI